MNMTLKLRLTSKRKMTSKIADNLREGKQKPVSTLFGGLLLVSLWGRDGTDHFQNV